MMTRPVFISYIAGMDHVVGVARADLGNRIGVRVEMRHQIGHVHSGLAILSRLPRLPKAKRI